MVQELVLKLPCATRTAWWSTAVPLKIRPRGSNGEDAWGSQPGRLADPHVPAVALLWRAARRAHDAHQRRVDQENQVWVEKFRTATGELYVCSSSLRLQAGQRAWH
jgi:hypothetical protein